jgi:Nucleotidyl transferase AbiEii toxin, Type IV TA system
MDLDIQRQDDPESAQRDFLAATADDLDDYFVFSLVDMERRNEAEEGAAIRFHIRCELAGRLFDDITVDVGFRDALLGNAEVLRGPDLLDFADIPPVEVPAIPIVQHVAEKLHAYTRRYGRRGITSTRVKDLVDLVLIAESIAIPADQLTLAIRAVFKARATHSVPASLPRPPAEWRTAYKKMADEVGIESDLDAAFSVAASFLNHVLEEQMAGGTWNPTSRTWDAR